MTGSAVLAGDDVVWFCIHPGCVDAVVAGVAACGSDFRTVVIDKGIGKADGVVADGAVAAGVLVNRRCGLAQCAEGYVVGTAVVTGCAVSGDAAMVESCRHEPCHGMAEVTVLIGWQMVRSFDQLRIDRKELIDVATFAAARNVLMLSEQEHAAGKCHGGIVADAAIFLRGYVIGFFRRCNACVVAGGAVRRVYPCMVESNAGEAVEIADVMARRAVERGGQVIFRLAGTDPAIMTGGAIAGIDTDVVEGCVSEVHCVVACYAIKCGRNMTGELTDRDHIVVAGRAIIDDAEVVVAAGRETARRMADTAVFAGRHVIGRFAACSDPMAGSAVTDDVCMIDKRVTEIIGVVAESAVGAGCDMCRDCGTFAGCVDAVVIVVTRAARLYRRIRQAVIEHAAETEGVYAVAGGAVDVSLGVANTLAGSGHTMA